MPVPLSGQETAISAKRRGLRRHDPSQVNGILSATGFNPSRSARRCGLRNAFLPQPQRGAAAGLPQPQRGAAAGGPGLGPPLDRNHSVVAARFCAVTTAGGAGGRPPANNRYMPVTKITLSTAMRARDVSQPHEEHLAEAAERGDAVIRHPEATRPEAAPPKPAPPADQRGAGGLPPVPASPRRRRRRGR